MKEPHHREEGSSPFAGVAVAVIESLYVRRLNHRPMLFGVSEEVLGTGSLRVALPIL